MSEPIAWLPDGTPHNLRFGDVYRSSQGGGLEQARQTFLGGCGLPGAWAGRAHWCILETGFGLGLNFLTTWAAWRSDAQRPHLLHFVSTEAHVVAADDILRAVPAESPQLQPLARALARQFVGLLPGAHRLVFEDGRVLLTLHVGRAQETLRKERINADSIYLDGFAPARNPDMWSLETLRAVVRQCRPGTHLATWCVARSVRETLTRLGFAVQRVPGVPPKRHNLQANFAPPWQARLRPRPPAPACALGGRQALVLGAGLAGAAAAASLARRGWQVLVLDAAPVPAAGASALPVGLFCPHASTDDALISRISRAGVRQTSAQLHTLTQQGRLQPGMDWDACGVLEHAVRRAPAWVQGGWHWSRPASAAQLAAAGLPAQAQALWHAQGGWVRPARLVQALLLHSGAQWRGGCRVARLVRAPCGFWQALDAQDAVLAGAHLVVLALGADTEALLRTLRSPGKPAPRWPLQRLHGQVSHAAHTAQSLEAMPPFPVNGLGSLVGRLPLAGAHPPWGWVAGSTFERDAFADANQAYAANGARLCALLPRSHTALGDFFAAPTQPTWRGVRCAAPDRLPLVGPLPGADDGLWALTALGARGLSLALLCAELLAARLHGEPLPLEMRLARALFSERLG